MAELRSAKWFEGTDIQSFCHRAWTRHSGLSDDALRGRPVIGICNMWSELVGCNVHLRAVAQAVKRGVHQAGGVAFEFPVMVPGDALQKPAAMMYRNLASMDVEETIRSNPLDAVVLLAGCDKSLPAAVMGAISADLSFLVVPVGPALPGYWRGKRVGSGAGLWGFADMARTGEISSEEYLEAESSFVRSHGTCMDMGTASTMACLSEGLGLSLPGAAAVPAVDSRRMVVAERSGARAVELATRGGRAGDLISPASFRNAICLLEALGGSTNAIIHLTAIAGRIGINLQLEDFGKAAHVPVIANIEPSGEYLMEDFFYAGGVQAVIKEILPLLDGDLMTVSGATIAEQASRAPNWNPEVIRPLERPVKVGGAHAILRGNLAPDGAVIKRSAASPDLLRHRGKALVFDDVFDLNERIEDPDLEVTGDTVMILRNGGPIGAPGFPEFGTLPIPSKLLKEGVTDLVRISDSRISGTSFGTLVCHVAPEAAVGGPIGLVRTGDVIELDADAGRLEVHVDDEELTRRAERRQVPATYYSRGYGKLFTEQVLQAPEGCDFRFLRNLEGEVAPDLPPLLMRSWVSP